ncbi:MAG: tetraacyldisaccharide 4'-kinase [Bdellovibrionales bacterium GWB1_55_8]|nr:MAG: tetraacyldisaccharide 4'-kinase [Bdellovibrionales bacterium GWB1_55_8]
MLNPLIRAASEIWSAGSGLSRLLATIGITRCVRLPVRVVSVGNIQAGGAGKTPLVAQIAREAHDRGLRVCILSRGYGGKWERVGGLISPLETQEPLLTADCGDECALLRTLAPHAFIAVGADRIRQFRRAQESGAEIDLVILDDGFQNRRIRKDLEIVAVTSASPWKVLHRDSKSALAHADLLVWTKGETLPDSDGSAAPMVKVRFAVTGPEKAGPVWLVAGVADGESVLTSARQAGYEISRSFLFPDHAIYTDQQVREILGTARRTGKRVALTGKDWVKWREFGVRPDEVIVLEVVVEFVSGRESWVRALWGSE